MYGSHEPNDEFQLFCIFIWNVSKLCVPLHQIHHTHS